MKKMDISLLILIFCVLTLFIHLWLIYCSRHKYKRDPTNTRYSILAEHVKILTRQCARWMTAAMQDKNPLIALLHGQYGVGYFNAIQDIASPEQFEKITKLDWKRFKKEIMSVQDDVNRRAAAACPNLTQGLNRYLGMIGGSQ
jgi:hypothetical protein